MLSFRGNGGHWRGEMFSFGMIDNFVSIGFIIRIYTLVQPSIPPTTDLILTKTTPIFTLRAGEEVDHNPNTELKWKQNWMEPKLVLK